MNVALRSVIAALLLAGTAAAQDFETVKFDGASFTVCTVDLKKTELRIFLNDPAGKPFSRFDTLKAHLEAKDEKLIFAMNAGMYHGDFSAVGLHVENGMTVNPLNLENDEGNFFMKPNGVFGIADGKAFVVTSERYSAIKSKVSLASQSGPMLVIENRIHPRFRRHSDNKLFRNGVGVSSPTTVHFVITDEIVNLHHFARLFRDKLKCRNALFFDGTISSLYSTELERNDFRMDLGPIVGVTAAKKKSAK